jgi:ubiquinone/menaquinone biosynthesis C-methylase UbiE
MNGPIDDFGRLEYAGWERVAGVYDGVWASLTRQFVDPLLRAMDIVPGISVLDVACGPGYVAAAARRLGAIPTGVDFSREMILQARTGNSGIEFVECDAQNLPFAPGTFERVSVNFGLLHFAHPEKALAEACRVLKHGGRLGFTLWAKPEENPGAQIMNNAIEAYADLSITLPAGPPYYLYADRNACRQLLQSIGFMQDSVSFETLLVNWIVPSLQFYFDAELNAGVRTAALLALQSPDRVSRIRAAVEKSVQQYATRHGYAIPMAAYIVTATKE